jgi:TRAP transporter TAXI family solute receptor
MLSKKLVGAALACCLLPVVAVAGPKQITIATQPVGTAMNAVGNAMAEVFVSELGARTTAQPYAGNAVYSPLLNSGDLTLAMTTTYALGLDLAGTENTAPMQELRTVARLWRLPYGYFVHKNSGLKTVSDLKGKRVVVDIRAAVSLKETNEFLLEAGGVSVDEVEQVDVAALPQGVKAAVDGTVDSAPMALPVAMMQEANATVPGGVNFLEITGPNANQEFLSSKAPGLTLVRVKAGTMPGVDVDKTVFALELVLYSSTHETPEHVAEMLNALQKNWPKLQEQFGFLRTVQADQFVDAAAMSAPYHEGAVAHFKSVGQWSDEAEARQQELLSRLK